VSGSPADADRRNAGGVCHLDVERDIADHDDIAYARR